MSAHQRHRLASVLASCVFAAGATGCGVDGGTSAPDPQDPVQPDPSDAQQRIERDLGRLEALELLDLGVLATTRTEHQRQGGAWSSSPVAMTAEEQAQRLSSLANAAEAAVAGIDASDIDAGGFESICYALGDDDKYCLTTAMVEASIQHLNELEIVEVTDIVRAAPAASGFCYSSWETVGVDDCVRGLKLEAVVKATHDFPRSVPPEE